DVAELTGRRGVRIVRSAAGGRRLLAVRAPVTFVRAAVRVEHDDAVIAAVGDVDLVGRIVDSDRGGTIQRRLTVGSVHLARRADLQQELAVLRELQDVCVGWRSRAGWRGCAASSTAGGWLR